MSLPGNVLSTSAVESVLLAPDERERDDMRQDFERGGVALNNPSQGLNVRNWRAWTDGTTVWVAPDPEGTPATAVLTGARITELALAFDQNMQTTLAFVDEDVTKLHWYDTLTSSMATTVFSGASSPLLTLDDKRPGQLGNSDVVFAYVRAGQACYRQQRDRFGVEYVLGPMPVGGRLLQVGMGVNGRLQFKVRSGVVTGFSDLRTDELVLARDTELMVLGAGATAAATWRSRMFEDHEQGAFGWALVEASAYPVTLRVWGDGRLVAEQAVASDAPVRLRAWRAREWQVEVSGAARVVGVRLAEVREELEGDDADLLSL